MNTNGTQSFAPQFIYNGTALYGDDYYQLGLQVLTLDTDTNITQAVECYVYDAAYAVTITQGSPFATMDVVNVILHNRVVSGNANYSVGEGLQNAMSTILSSGVEHNVVYDSPLMTALDGDWGYHWADMMVALPSLMDNFSLSLLNPGMQFAYGTTKTRSVENVNTTCSFSTQVFEYDPTRLLATYAAALSVAAACVLAGFWAIHLNGVEESLNFSRLLGSILNDRLFDDRYDLGMDTNLKADNDGDSQLKPSVGISY